MSPDAPDTGSASVAETGSPADAGATDAEASAPVDAAFSLGSWTAVSNGVTAATSGTGPNIVIAYGGYTATLEDSQDWVAQLTSVRLAALGVGQLYAVQGPADPDYSSREIGNSELAAAVLPEASAATRIVVIAHSSGDFVAGEFFTFADPAVIAKITYFDLDGGDATVTAQLVASMRGVYFCGADDPAAGYSENYSSDQSLSAQFSGSHLFTVDATGSGCDMGAGWCLHDTLITSHPHDPTTFDLALDYTDFTNGRQVVSSYLDQAVSDGAL
jgi:hypothetical protein